MRKSEKEKEKEKKEKEEMYSFKKLYMKYKS